MPIEFTERWDVTCKDCDFSCSTSGRHCAEDDAANHLNDWDDETNEYKNTAHVVEIRMVVEARSE